MTDNLFPEVSMEYYGDSMIPRASGKPVAVEDQTDAGLYVLIRWESPFEGNVISDDMRMDAAKEFLKRYPYPIKNTYSGALDLCSA